ncbi:hypothetical protein [Enterovirga sp.]|uniref:hypothetical protein n=1 Tax=Enterovirga sp. TaxID=2026350 RepID=UPI00261838BE|nr:hypothetical protein [Enterovirga sp.]MDB5591773.1 hypothetical protein [Enterovirga sp.]
MSAWRDSRNERSLARLRRALPAVFPGGVLAQALARPLIPPTPRRAVEGYWRAHPLRADRLARALARLSGTPEGWAWTPDAFTEGRRASFRAPPAPYREPAFARGPGHCCVCGQPVFRFGWHRDLWGDGKPNRRATWHSACVVAWQLWCDPSGHVQALKRAQGRRCAESGRRLLRSAEIDHRVPLFRVWREHRDASWPELLGFWGRPNLQVINKDAHLRKCAGEASFRADERARAANGALAA